MSIKALKKITLYGLASEKESLLRGLQSLGCMHLIPLAQPQNGEGELTEPQSAKEALTWLSNCPTKRREARTSELSADQLVARVLDNKHLHRKAADERDALIKRISEVRPWGDFSFCDIDDMASVRLWFYVVPHNDMDAVRALELPWEVVHKDQQNHYVVVLAEDEPAADLLPVRRSHVGGQPLSELEANLETAEMKLEDIQGERESLTRWIYIISQAAARFEDEKSLRDVSSTVLEDDQFFLVSGWMPADREKDVRRFIDEQPAAVTIEEPGEDDKPPTLLDNPEILGGGTEAMAFYQLPSYRSWDPSTMVFFSFSLFFAMIMNDAAYSLVIALIVYLMRNKLGTTIAGKRISNLAYFMAGLGFIWGVCAGSYFGYTPPPETFIGSLKFIEMNDYTAMMKVSIIVGGLHIIIANLVTAWLNRGKLNMLAPIGWAIAIAGGLTYWLSYLGSIDMASASQSMMIAGAAMLFLFTSTRQIEGIKDIFLRLVDGFHALYEISSVFGDILSYMRLFALGLAGASLAVTFNSLAFQVKDSMPGIGILFCFLILVLGHLLNFTLSIVSGVVHGLRLNVIEFFKWSLSDEGYPFKPFQKRED